MSQPRVFFNGDTVPAGVCVLAEDGEVFYLDDTEDCDCEDRDLSERCEECSYDIVNWNNGPLVEVELPDYVSVVLEANRRRLRGVS